MDKNILRALSILHTAFVGGLIFFGGIVFFLVYTDAFPPIKEVDKIMQVAVIIACAAGLYFSITLFKKKVLLIRESFETVDKKMDAFRAACLLQWALLDGPAIFTIIGFLLTGNYAFLVLAGIMIAFLYLLKPTKQKIILQLQLNEKEAEEL